MNKIDFMLIFDVLDANPNGDPDAGNMPRVDVESNQGLVTDVCLKRKIRNFIQLTKKDVPGYDIYIKEKAILTNEQKRAYEALGFDPKKPGEKERDAGRLWMCKNFFDIRTFGAVMSLKEANCGQVRGPVQLSFARSVDSIISAEYAVTRCAVATEKEAQDQKGDNRTMGRKFTVPYAVYSARGTMNPFLAEQTGFSEQDWQTLVEAMVHLFDFDASAARPAGAMAVRKLVLFKHNSQLGNAPAHKLMDAVSITRKADVEVARSFKDYEVTIDQSAFPAGVTVEVIEN